MTSRTSLAWSLTAALLVPGLATAQDSNFTLPIPAIEAALRASEFRIKDMRGSRWEDDRTQRVMLEFADTTVMLVKWAKAAPNGEAFNNQPRYEAAAYEFQKLFLDEKDYIVPPTVIRSVPLDFYRTIQPNVGPTFGKTSSVIVVLQYWLYQVVGLPTDARDRFDEDARYAYHLANTNVFSYLVRHSDSNTGNFLLSSDSTNPRVFAVDNGVAFGYNASDRGTAWRDLRVKRVPARTIERLRKVTLDDLRKTLSVVAEFEIRDGVLVAVQPGPGISSSRGVRKNATRVQFGLTEHEIQEIEKRIFRLLERVDDGKLQTF